MVEEQFHAAIVRVSCSRSARYGKSCKISSWVIPDAKLRQDIVDGDSHPPDTRFSATFSRLHGYDVLVIHWYMCRSNRSILAQPPFQFDRSYR
jgi:hypothetical protein